MLVEWSGRHLTPAGGRGKAKTLAGEAEEAWLPPRGKQVSGAQWNELFSRYRPYKQ